MTKSPRRRFKKPLLVFLGSLAAHGLVFESVATQVFGPPSPQLAYATPAAPLTFAPKPRPPKQAPPSAPRGVQARRAETIASSQRAIVAAGRFDSASAGLAPALSLPEDAVQGGDSGPLDLTDRTPAQPRYPIHPGYWEVVEHWPLISRTERWCVEPWNIVRFMAQPCNHIYHCRYPVQEIGADTVRFEGVITGRQTRVDVKGGGDYSPTTLSLKVSGLGHWRILPLIFTASLRAQFLGPDCPLTAKRIQQRD